MDFFRHQDRARTLSSWLLVLFGIAVAAMIVTIYLVLAAAAGAFAVHTGADASRIGWWNPGLLLQVAIGTLAVIGIASLVRTSSLRAGGGAVAEMLGGRLVVLGTDDLRERRLLNVVEEMAIASSVPMPEVYVLDHEPGINAFAAGHSLNDSAVVVTKGTLERLDREELQGVVAHEFSHILHGDMRINIRLMGVLFGILVIAMVGRMILRVRYISRGSRRGQGQGGVAAVMLLGLALLIVGYIGLFFGRLIKAAVSRQREFLADASAVQFTRNPGGIGGALKKIGGFTDGSLVQARAAEEASHFFFSEAVHYSMFQSLFRTHPDLAERIRRVDPSFRGEYPAVPAAPVDVADYPEGVAQALGFASPAAECTVQAVPAEVMQSIGDPLPGHRAYASELLENLPDELHGALGDPMSASSLIFALLLDTDPGIASRQVGHIETEAGPELLRETKRLEGSIRQLDPRMRLPLAQLAFPALRRQTPRQMGRFRRTCELLVAEDAELSVFEYAVHRTLLDRLTRPAHKAGGAGGQRRLGPLLGECRTLLSCLAWFGHADEDEARRVFDAGYTRLDSHGWEKGRLLARDGSTLTALDGALSRLRNLCPSVRRQILEAAAHTVLLDGAVTLEEAELLRVVADILDCPLPPLVCGRRQPVSA